MTKPLLAILCLIALAIIVSALQGDKYKEFMKTAAKTGGRIDQKEERFADPGKRSGRREHWLHYSYRAPNGMEYHKQDRIEFDDLWMDFRESYPIDIYYNPKNPAESYVAPVIERRAGK